MIIPDRPTRAVLCAAAIFAIVASSAAPAGAQVSGPTLPGGNETLTGDWLGARTRLEDRGITFDFTLTADYSRSLHGGLDTERGAFRNLFDAAIEADAEKLVGVHGGRFFVEFLNQAGPDASRTIVGDLQLFDNLDADGRTELAQLWYEQSFAGGAARVKVGKVDANTEFAAPDNAVEFLNSAFAYSPTILLFPTYPDPATSVNVFLNHDSGAYVGAGVYDGAAAEGYRTGSRGPATFFGAPADLFLIAEGGARWALRGGGLPGRVGLGGWRHTGTFERFGGGTRDGTGGAYVTFDQALLRINGRGADDRRGVDAFAQYGYADPAVSVFHHHAAAGVVSTGMVPRRPSDAVGVAATYVRLSPAAGLGEDFELAVEAFYKLRLTPWLILKPDLQYVLSPGGGAAPDALVATLRLELAL